MGSFPSLELLSESRLSGKKNKDSGGDEETCVGSEAVCSGCLCSGGGVNIPDKRRVMVFLSLEIEGLRCRDGLSSPIKCSSGVFGIGIGSVSDLGDFGSDASKFGTDELRLWRDNWSKGQLKAEITLVSADFFCGLGEPISVSFG